MTGTSVDGPQSDGPAPAFVAAWCAVGGAVLLALLGAPASIPIVVALLGGVVLLGHRRQQQPAPHRARAGDLDDRPSVAAGRHPSGVDDVRRMSDEELLRAWRSSCLRLRRLQQLTGLSDASARVALERSWYLDELERRHPRGVTAWIATGARAADDPNRYLNGRIPQQRRHPEDQ